MTRFWVLGSANKETSWVKAALESYTPTPNITWLHSQEAWLEAVNTQRWPHVIIGIAPWPWGNVKETLTFLREEQISTPFILISNETDEETLARFMDLGLDDYQPATPPQPRLLQARLRRLLHTTSFSPHRLDFFQQLNTTALLSRDPYLIAKEALKTLSTMTNAQWGTSAFVNTERDPRTFEILGAYCKSGVCPFSPQQRYPLHLLPPIPSSNKWTVFSLHEIPLRLNETLQSAGVQRMGLYHLPLGEDMYGLLMLGWSTEDIASDVLQFAASIAHWLSASVHHAIKLTEERRALQQAKSLTNLVLSLNRLLDVDTLFKRLLEGMRQIVPYEQASVWEWTEEGELVLRQVTSDTCTPQEFIEQACHFTPAPAQWPTMRIIKETKRPLLIPDTRNFKQWQAVPVTENIRSWMGVPILYDDEVLGVLCLDATQPQQFTIEHLRMTQTLTSAVSIALQNARLFQAEHRRRTELNALRIASLKLVSSLNTEEVLEDLLNEALQLTQADDAHLFLYDGERLQFAAAIWDGEMHDHPVSEPRPEGITYTVARSGQPRMIEDTHQDPLFAGENWRGAIISLPLRSHGKVRGVMNVAWHKPRRFLSSTVTLLQMLSDYAAIAIENASLVTTLQDKVHQLSGLAKASAALRETDSVHEVAQTLADHAIQLGEAQFAMVVRFINEDKSLATIEHVIGLDANLIGRFFDITQRGLTHNLLKARRSLAFQNLSRSTLLQHPSWVRRIGPAVAIPLRTRKGEIVGMLLIGRERGKPLFTSEITAPLEALAEMGATALQRAQTAAQLEEAFLQTVLALSHAMDVRDTYHGMHSKQLAEWAEAIAYEMGLSAEETEVLRMAAMLHDIGKIGIPDEVLLKPGALNDEEWEIMKRHPTIGAQILRPLKRLQPVAEIVAAHHERWDGSGYPRGLKGEEIPLGARILAVVDSYGAMIDQRVYHAPKPHEQAIAEIREQAGKLYDPKVVEAFLNVIDYLSPLPSSESKE